MNIKHVFGATLFVSLGILVAMIVNAPTVSADTGCTGAACPTGISLDEEVEITVGGDDVQEVNGCGCGNPDCDGAGSCLKEGAEGCGCADKTDGCGCGMEGCTSGDSCDRLEGGCGCAAKQKVECGCGLSGCDGAGSCQKEAVKGCGCNR